MYLQNWVAKKKILLDSLDKICSVLNCDIMEFFDSEEKRK